MHIPFPLVSEESSEDAITPTTGSLYRHPSVLHLNRLLKLHTACGYATLVRTHPPLQAAEAEERKGTPAKEKASLRLDFSHAGAMSKDPRKCISDEALAARDDHNYAEWTLFDFVFGLPLFDERLNRAVLDNVAQTGLFGAQK